MKISPPSDGAADPPERLLCLCFLPVLPGPPPPPLTEEEDEEEEEEEEKKEAEEEEVRRVVSKLLPLRPLWWLTSKHLLVLPRWSICGLDRFVSLKSTLCFLPPSS